MEENPVNTEGMGKELGLKQVLMLNKERSYKRLEHISHAGNWLTFWIHRLREVGPI